MQKLLKLIKKIGYYMPFSVYLVVFCAIIIPGYGWLNKLSKLPDSAYKDIFSLLLLIALLFSFSILCFGFLTVLFSFGYFKWKQAKNMVTLHLKTSAAAQGKQSISIQINPVFMPLIGFLKVRLLYDSTHFSDKFSVITKNGKPFGASFDGTFNWNLPEIREYQIEKVIIYFEDFFQFFSFAATIDTSNRFYVSPTEQDLTKIHASPRKTEDTSIRIDELKRVEGELINYKSFENNDDVRRIVWKIYAKNKELVVRIPEIMDPYASHIYLYTSFHTHFDVKGNDVIETLFLNYYKTICWSIYKQLAKKGLEVRYISDQPIPPTALSEPDEQVKYAITLSHWQDETHLKDFVKPGNASVLIVSSLDDPEQIRDFADNFGSDISIVFVPLTECLRQNDIKDWIRWLFITNENDKLTSYKTKWNLSPLRFKLNENETDISGLLKQTDKASIIRN
ncbi:MAG: hypothetical protein HY062_12460 [Bacteroidetes bacterium]|nr:hypothetical protein [Bacteroidota bacterium]